MVQQKIPNFSYHSKLSTRNISLSIKADGNIIDEFDNPNFLNSFYETFGYTTALALKGILAEEFIWTEYISPTSAKHTSCLQMHIIEFLNKHSAKFRGLYGGESKGWLATHAAGRIKDELCIACRLNEFCSKGKI